MSAEDRSISPSSPTTTTSSGLSLGNLPEILDVVVQKLGWFRTTFAMAGRTCREAVDCVPSPLLGAHGGFALDAHGVTGKRLRHREITPLAVAAMEGDVEAMVWLMQLFDEEASSGAMDSGTGPGLSILAAKRGKSESLTCLRGQRGVHGTSDVRAYAAEGGHLEVL